MVCGIYLKTLNNIAKQNCRDLKEIVHKWRIKFFSKTGSFSRYLAIHLRYISWRLADDRDQSVVDLRIDDVLRFFCDQSFRDRLDFPP